VGSTTSTDFPTTSGSLRPGSIASLEGFLVRLDASGSTIQYGTYVGGSSGGVLRTIALGPNGAVYVAGNMRAGFPTTAGAVDATHSGPATAVNLALAVISPAGSGAADLLYATYLSGDHTCQAHDVAVDAAGDAYLVGQANVPWGSGVRYPTTANAFRPTVSPKKNSNHAASVFSKVRPGGNGASDLLYSTFLSEPAGSQAARGVALDGQGRAYVVGTTSKDGKFLTTTNGFDRSENGSLEGFLAVIDPTLSGATSLRYATYVGGDAQDELMDVALDAQGRAVTCGWGGKVNVAYPTTTNAVQRNPAGGLDLVLTVLDTSLSPSQQLVYSTFFGGTGNDSASALAFTPAGSVAIAGWTTSSGGFPSGVPWPFSGTFGGGAGDVLVVLFDL
jgi:hypothetical protein